MDGVVHSAWGTARPWPAVVALDVAVAVSTAIVAVALALPAIRSQGFGTIWFGAIGIGLLLLVPPRRWPTYLVVITLATVFASAQAGFSPAAVAFRLPVDIAATVAVAVVLRRHGSFPLTSTPAAWLFIGVAFAFAAIRAAVVAVSVAIAPSPTLGPGFNPVTMGLGAAIGTLILVPLTVLALSRERWPRVEPRQALVSAGAVAATAAVAAVTFLRPPDTMPLGLAFLTIPLLVMLATRFSQLALTAAMAAVAIVMSSATSLGLGPLAPVSSLLPALRASALDVQLFLLAVPVAALLLSAAVADRRAARHDLEIRVAELSQLSSDLARTEERFRTAVVRAAIPMSFGTVDGTVNDFNEAMRRFYERPEVELRTLSWEDLTHPDDVEQERIKLEGLRSGQIDHFRLLKRYVMPDGRIKWGKLAVSAANVGEPGSWAIAQVVDVTAEIEAQEELRRSQEMFRAAVHSATIPMSFGPLAGGFTEINEARCAFHERTREELLTMDWRDLTLPEDVDRAEPLSRALADGEIDSFRLTQRFVMPDGRIKWGDLTAARIPLEQEEVDFAIVQIVDITAEVEARQELERAREVLSAALDRAPVPMTFGPALGQHTQFNDAFCDFVRMPREQLLTVPWELFCHPDDVPAERELARALAASEIDHYQLRKRFVRSDGAVRHADVTVNAVHLPGDDEVYAVAQAVDVTDVLLAQERAQHLADNDLVTGLRSRTWMTDHITLALKQHPLLTVMLIDLSEFLVINRTLGLEAGDDALQLVARTVASALPEGCAVGRFDGNVLIAALPEVSSHEEAEAVIDQVVAAASREFIVRGNRIARSVTIGAAISRAGSTTISVLRDADLALTRAKARGRAGGYVTEAARDHGTTTDLLRLEHELREALDFQQFRVHYQPKVDLATMQVCGYEALVRWQHPERGLLPPGDFIDVMEQSGLVVPLSGELLRMVGSMLHESADMAPVSINVSAVELAHPEWLPAFERGLAEHAIEPERLTIEITETTMLQLGEDSHRALHRIRDLGIGIDVDDFGTGYASVGLLRQVPVTGLKLDRSFVSPLDEPGAPGLPLVRGVAALAEGLGLQATAEGVETATQARLLLESGWTIGQGYLFGRPAASLPGAPAREAV